MQIAAPMVIAVNFYHNQTKAIYCKLNHTKMEQPGYTQPFYIFFLVFPVSISQGFVTVALPYLHTQHGFSVAEAAGIVAVGFSANLWRFLWGLVVDLFLSLRSWFGLALSHVPLHYCCSVSLLILLKEEAYLPSLSLHPRWQLLLCYCR